MGKISIKLTLPHRKDGWKMTSQVEVKKSLQLKALSVLLVMTQSHSICYLECRRSATTTRSSCLAFPNEICPDLCVPTMGLPFLKRLDMLIEGCLDAHFVFCWTPPLPCTHPEMTKLLPVMTNSWQLELKEHTKACLKKRKSENKTHQQCKGIRSQQIFISNWAGHCSRPSPSSVVLRWDSFTHGVALNQPSSLDLKNNSAQGRPSRLGYPILLHEFEGCCSMDDLIQSSKDRKTKINIIQKPNKNQW